jgi:NhaP-type Na+/H+ or K+/H+ antiporter
MSEYLLHQLGLLAVLGIGSQWLAWRLRLPSILLLLVSGFLAGPVFDLINPDELLGDLLMPLVAVSVGLIMYEGGLTLKFSELRETGKVIRNLISVGALATWAIGTVAARALFGWDWALATLLGGILVVTGPTVIMPLLRHVQPSKSLASTLKWEGILIDPIGALLALLVFEAILARDLSDVPLIAVIGFTNTLFVGAVLGGAGAGILLICFRKHWVPDYLQNPLSLMIVVAMFAISNSLQHESGLLTVTIMGIVLANQKLVTIRHIVEFKENLRVLLIGALFILLASRLEFEQVRRLSVGSGLAFLAVMMFLARPVSVLLCTWGTKMNWKEKLFLSWMAPRGIVAAAVSSLFAFRLVENGHARADELVAVTFLVIVGTVAIYGLTAAPLAKWLKLSKPNPQGLLILGAHPFARAFGRAVNDAGFPVVLADTNAGNVAAARMEGLATYHGSVLAEGAHDKLDLTGVGRLLALTPNPEVNSLSVLHFTEQFGRAGVFQLPPDEKRPGGKGDMAHELRGRRLFGKSVTLAKITVLLGNGATVKATRLTNEFTYEHFRARYGSSAIPLCIALDTELILFTEVDPPQPKPNQTLIALVELPNEDGQKTSSA